MSPSKASLEIRFVSRNPHKFAEAQQILEPTGVRVVPLKITLEELQTTDTNTLVKDKTLKAFRHVGRPLFVEHTGLYLSHINGLPGGLTQVFWDGLEADRFSELFGKSPDPAATAKTIIGFTDGQKFFSFEGQVSGKIADSPAGPRDFQWDCVFIANGQTLTFAELGDMKNAISMRRKAFDKFADFLAARNQA